MKKQDPDNTNARDLNKCPECSSKNFAKGWGADIEHTYFNGKCIKREYHTAENYSDFTCQDCGWHRTDIA